MKTGMKILGAIALCFLVTSVAAHSVLAYENRIPIQGTLESGKSQIYELGYFDTTGAVTVKIKLSTSNIDRAGVVTVHYLVSGYTYDKGVIYPQVTWPAAYTDEHEFILSGSHGLSGEVAILIEHSVEAGCPVTFSGTIEW